MAQITPIHTTSRTKLEMATNCDRFIVFVFTISDSNCLDIYYCISKRVRCRFTEFGRPRYATRYWFNSINCFNYRSCKFSFGTMMAWLVTRFQFPGRLYYSPWFLSLCGFTCCCGFAVLTFYGSNSWFGGWLEGFDIQLMFSWPGMALVTIL